MLNEQLGDERAASESAIAQRRKRVAGMKERLEGGWNDAQEVLSEIIAAGKPLVTVRGVPARPQWKLCAHWRLQGFRSSHRFEALKPCWHTRGAHPGLLCACRQSLQEAGKLYTEDDDKKLRDLLRRLTSAKMSLDLVGLEHVERDHRCLSKQRASWAELEHEVLRMQGKTRVRWRCCLGSNPGHCSSPTPAGLTCYLRQPPPACLPAFSLLPSAAPPPIY